MDFDKARFNMVEQQIRPWNVLDFDVLDALALIPREQFTQEHQRGYAYAELSLTLPNGTMMLEPKQIARMIQGLSLQKTDRVLEIGTGSGYASALLSILANEITTFDIDPDQQKRAQNTLKQLGYDHNIRFEVGDGLNSTHETYDAIFINGSLNREPEMLLNTLTQQGGRMVVMTGTHPVQQCWLITRHNGQYTREVLFESVIPGLNDQTAPAKSRFKF